MQQQLLTSSLQLWSEHKYDNENKKKLTISLVSDLTNIPFETTRRRIIQLKKKKWILYSKENGIQFDPTSTLNHLIVDIIHPYEKELLKEFLVSFLMAGKDDK